MINPYRILGENLPERLPAARNAFSADPAALRAWADGLPRANQQVYLRELQRVLREFRGRRFDGFARLEALEVLRPMLLEITTLLAGRLQGSPFPLVGARADLARQLLDIHRDLALGYRMAVVEACAPSGKVPFLRGKQVTQALVRALYHHSRWLAAAYYLYRTPEPGTWAQLYALAAFAADRKLDSRAVEDSFERREMTAALLQNQAILLALANAYRFSQREQMELWILTRDTASLIALTPERFAAAGALILIDKDLPPAFVSRAPEPGDGDVYWVDLHKLNDLVRAAVSHAGAAREAMIRLSRNYQLTMPVEMLKRALEGWSQDASRMFRRLEGGYELYSVLGLTSLHYQLAGQRDLGEFLDEMRTSPMSIAERANWTGSGVETAYGEVVPAQVRDQSLGGYRVRWHAEHGVRVRMGELVGMALPLEDGARDWSVGTVRWLRYEDDGAIEAGIDLLARRSQAAALRGLDANGSSTKALRALALDGVQGALEEQARALFLIDGIVGMDAQQVEVVHTGKRWDSSQAFGAQIFNCPGMQALRRIGDYLVVSPTESA